ncbi:glycosyltransferase [Devosia algicola]|uniref:Glycosyltransferase n=1 Tax=Devosia algicola TaxID=3026418 RepID=A0ABY7YME5_9HYPH|nr:glycosyltransferase [Devosia algicola]WDR02353.1 glycosyltransferase [Devosia algicola]
MKLRLRLVIERVWLRAFLRSADIVVQTPTMARKVQEIMDRPARVMPFSPLLNQITADNDKHTYDYVYVASGEAHKNHRRLVEAWEILGVHGLNPTLCLTLNKERDGELLAWTNARAQGAGLSIRVEDVSDPVAIAGLLARSRALIFPSMFESFGLPLVEASQAGLPIVASERDYVRDVVVPVVTFDPESARSIAQAVMRHQGHAEPPIQVPEPAAFLDQILAAR